MLSSIHNNQREVVGGTVTPTTGIVRWMMHFTGPATSIFMFFLIK